MQARAGSPSACESDGIAAHAQWWRIETAVIGALSNAMKRLSNANV